MKGKLFCFTLVLIFLSFNVKAEQPNASPSPTPAVSDNPRADVELPPSKWNEVNSIIDEIRVQNPPHNYRLKGRIGLIQMITNTNDDVALGQGGTLPAMGGEIVANVWGNLGVEVRGLYAQNLLADPASINGPGKSIWWLDTGPRYTFYFDNSKLDNNMAFKVLYHQSDANFLLKDKVDRIFITHYTGVSFGFERSIPITRKLGVLAEFDLLQNFQATTSSRLAVRQYGYGFEISGEIYYQIELFGQSLRMGVSYWQQGNDNELEDKDTFGRNSQFQLARSLFVNLALLE